MELSSEVVEKFYNSVEKTTYCWEWKGFLNSGSPAIKYTHKVYSSRRVSLFLAGREVSSKERVFTKMCGNKLCVNPDHLVVGEEARFFAKVSKLSEGCWIWLGNLDNDMYGRHTIHRDGKKLTIGAHIYSWQLHNNHTITKGIGLEVCHTCDHPYCVNPDHLFLGTKSDNMQDMIQKGKFPSRKGESNAFSILTADDVREIRRLYQSGIKKTVIASQFHIKKRTVTSIVTHESWKHIT